MKCNKCNNEATTHLRQNINGEVTELWLCSECAEKMGVGGMFSGFDGFGLFSTFDSMLGDFDSLFSGQKSLLSNFLGGSSVSSLPARKKCSVCGSTFSDITERGKVGCADCYETFANLLRPTIERIHGRTSHEGKLPGKSVPPAKEPNKAKPQPAAVPTDNVAALKAELKRAIDAEEYEKAAELRDKIRSLENK